MWPVIYLFTVLGALVFIAIVAVTVYRLSREQERRQNLRRLVPWLVKGLIPPFALWVVMNLGISWQLQPFMPQVQAAQNSGTSWIPAFLHVTAAGLFAVSSYWAAVTLGWVLFKIGSGLKSEDRADFRAICVTSLAAWRCRPSDSSGLAAGLTLGLAIGALFLPLAGYAPAVLHRVKLPPMYSRAIAKMNFGKYAEAEWKIIRQLENWENDSGGWLMLAELYATQFQDLAEAEQIVLEICDQPHATPSQISVATRGVYWWSANLRKACPALPPSVQCKAPNRTAQSTANNSPPPDLFFAWNVRLPRSSPPATPCRRPARSAAAGPAWCNQQNRQCEFISNCATTS